MAEVPQRMKNDPLRPPLARLQPESAHAQPAVSLQPSKEMLYQQRQKCELRRLLKHTEPELKSLDSAVDEELAEVLSSERGLTAAETGYEGEVLSRRWMFENCMLSNKTDPLTLKTPMAEGAGERGDVKRSSALFEQPWESLQEETVKGTVEVPPGQDPNAECEEEMVRIDVRSTRRMFESQCADTFRPSPDASHGKVTVTEDERGAVQKCKKAFEPRGVRKPHGANTKGVCVKQLDLTAPPQKQNTRVAVIKPNTEPNLSENQQGFTVITPAVSESPSNQPTLIYKSENEVETVENCQIKTREGLFINNPFISTNIDREQSNVCKTKTPNSTLPCGDSTGDSRASEDSFVANVKNRTQLFESMPFDKIKHQNRDDMETMVENINEILNVLYHQKAIHSHGSIIEVNETNLAKRAKYVLSQDGPVIQYDEVAEGGAQNFILQMLPRENLKPQVRYLKEDERGNVQVTIVDALVHHQHLTDDHDREFRTANVVQLIEDILDQDNSLRKGVIIQTDENQHAEVTIYSLYNYAEGDVKSYCPPQGCHSELDQPECAISDDSKPNVDEVKGDVKSTISSLLATGQEQNYSASVIPEVSVKGNVKLFRSCIEKGDLEYLKTLQAEFSEDEPSGLSMEPNVQQSDPLVQDSEPEWAPVDVKKLKNMFSEASVGQGPIQPKQVFYGNVRHTAKPSPALICQSTATEKSEFITTYDKSMLPHGQVNGKTLREGVSQKQGDMQDFKTAPQGLCPYLDPQADEIVHQAKLVEVVDDNAEISYLQAAICSLQRATEEAKASHHATPEQQKHTNQGFSEQPITSVRRGDDKVLKAPEVPGPSQNTRERDESALRRLPSVSCMTSEQRPDSQCRNTDASCEDVVTEERQPSECCAAEGQEGTEVVQKGHLKAAIRSLQSAATEQHQEEKEDIVRGNLQAALDSLGKSSMNVSQGDCRAAMIYRNSSKSHKRQSCKRLDEEPVQKTTEGKDGLLTESEPPPSVTRSQQEQVAMEALCSATAELPNSGQTTNKLATCPSSDNQPIVSGVPTNENKRPNSSKPAIPPKPDQLKVKGNQSTNTRNFNEATQIISTDIKTHSPDEQPRKTMPTKSMSYKDALCKGLSETDSTEPSVSSPDSEKHKHTKDVQKSEEMQSNQQTQGLEVNPSRAIIGDSTSMDEGNVSQPQETNVTEERKCSETCSVQGNENETDEKSIDFHEARRKFGGTQEVKKAPMKPKRVRIVPAENKKQKDTLENSNMQESNIDKSDKHEGNMEQGSKVIMREKRGKMETEDERRQRLSVHMDEIMRGNMTTANEIFDNLRKQEELQNILTKVEEIEQDTSNVDVKSMRRIFENVPTWVVSPKVKKQKQAKVESKLERSPLAQGNSQSMSSMAHVYGDLERASEEIMNLKEQTLARLMDIDEAIKKALYSVSTLKSDSDIAGLSGLFKESLGTVQGSSTSGNIRKISIESSRAKSPQAKGSPSIQREPALLEINQRLKPEVPAAKPQTSPLSSPAFISIESAVRKKDTPQLATPDASAHSTCQHSPKTEETFRTTKVLKCNNAPQNKKRDPRKGGQKQSSGNHDDRSNPRREEKALKVKAAPDGSKTVTENYERTDSFGNRLYSTKTSTVITTQPEAVTSFPGQAVTSQCTHQVTTYPEVRLPINTKPKI